MFLYVTIRVMYTYQRRLIDNILICNKNEDDPVAHPMNSVNWIDDLYYDLHSAKHSSRKHLPTDKQSRKTFSLKVEIN